MMVSGKDMLGMWTWMASFGFLAVIQQFIPREYTDALRRACRRLFQMCTPYIYCDFPEYENDISNSLYQDVEMYISSLRMEGAQRLSLSKPRNAKAVTFQLANDQHQVDTFDGAKLEWVHSVSLRQRPIYANHFETQSHKEKMYMLTIHKKDKERMLNKYMAHIEEKAAQLKLATRELLLYTNSTNREYFSRRNGPWQSVPFKHPASFSTLALDGDLKKNVLTDLEVFAASEDYYKRVGKPWKRGYLLYGPPGTGKSSMIAAIANKMRYDVYDLELTEVTSNTELRKLLLSTSDKAVIIIEDIDCSLDLSGQRKKKKKAEESKSSTSSAQYPIPGGPKDEQNSLTLSGLLNFVDGLWSSCGAERIFIFTTNHKEKLDPALLRAGRMDMHIHLSYCTFSAFKQLAENYLQISEHELYEKLEAAFEGSFMTPAEVSEVLILNQSEDVDVVLERVVEALDEHRVDPAILKKKEEEEAEEAEEAERAAAAAEAKAEADKKAKDSPPTDVPEVKQQVAERPPPPPNPAKKVEDKEPPPPPPKDSTDSAENVELTEPQKIETESEDLKGDLLLVKGEAETNQLEKDVVDVKEILDVSKAVKATTDSGGDESSGQLQAVKVKES